MKKKGLSIIIIAAMMIGVISGCGVKREVTENVALLEYAAVNDYTATVVQKTTERYAKENGLLFKRHPVKSNTLEDVEVEVKLAAESGADVIVCSGMSFEVPIYKLQGQYKDVKFIIVDGAPRKEEDSKFKVRKNTAAIIMRLRRWDWIKKRLQ